MVKALADRLAEAFGNICMKKLERNTGGMPQMKVGPTNFDERNATGYSSCSRYPACPDHLEKKPYGNSWK